MQETPTAGLRAIATLALASTLLNACTSYQRPKGAIDFGSRARVESSVPFVISSGGIGSSGSCRATHAKGMVNSASADTVHLTELADVVAFEATESVCSSLTRGTIFLLPETELKVRRFSVIRTGLLLGSIVGVVALAIGQSFDPYGGGGGPSCGIIC